MHDRPLAFFASSQPGVRLAHENFVTVACLNSVIVFSYAVLVAQRWRITNPYRTRSLEFKQAR